MTHNGRKTEPSPSTTGKTPIEASDVFARAEEEFSPDHPADLLGTLEKLDRQWGRADQALEAIARSISTNSTNPQFFYHLANTLRDRGCWQQAVDHYRRALQIDPDFVDAYVGLGAALRRQGRLEEAAAALRQALESRPDDAEAHVELAAALHESGDRVLGAEHLYDALAVNAKSTEAWSRLGTILREQGEMAEALDCYATALRQEKADPQAQFTASLIALQRGDFAVGWEGFEARKRARRAREQSTRKAIVWDEASLRRQSVLVRSEGNTADDLMFASCLDDFLPRVAECTIQCDPGLTGLFARSFSTATVVSADEACDESSLDAEVLLGSLPRHLRASLGQFPAHQGYLVPGTARRRHWRGRLDALGDGLRVGIAWRGPRRGRGKPGRLADCEQWQPLLQTPGVQWVSLQDGDDDGREAAQLAGRFGVRIHSGFNEFADLDDAASLVSALDLVIVVPGRLAHLAGALGVDAWVPLCSTPSWRWMAEGDTSPWYPSMRLYRQRLQDYWREVFAEMARDLAGRS